MAVWPQLAILIITNLPGLISSLKEIFELFGRDRVRARSAIREMRGVKCDTRGGRCEEIKSILDRYADEGE